MSNKLVSITSWSLLKRVKGEQRSGAGCSNAQMFKLSSRAAGSVNCDSIQIINSADQTVNVIGNVNGADGSGICLRVCLSSGLSSCYQVRRVIS